MAVRIERRRHRQFVTRHTEYHLRGAVCVGVRNRATNMWLSEHEALGTRLLGSLARTGHGFALVPEGELGASLWFSRKGMDVVTSAVTQVDRPPKTSLIHYNG
jgi:hypothetical protein